MKENPLDPENLEETPKDILYRSTRAGLGAFPVVGPAFAEIFSFGVKSPVEKRRNAFMLAVVERLEKLEQEKHVDINSLKTDDEFLDLLIQAHDIALKHSQTEKIKALQNAVVNSALKISISRDEKSMFLNIISDLTPIDITVLKLCYHPHEVLRKLVKEGYRLNEEKHTNDQQVTILNDFGKYLQIDSNFFAIILNNLETKGLLQNTKGTHSSGLPPKEMENIISGLISTTNERTTGFGRKFLQFVSEPQDN